MKNGVFVLKKRIGIVFLLIVSISVGLFITTNFDSSTRKSVKEIRNEKKIKRKKGRSEYVLNRLADPKTGKIPVGIREKELKSIQQLERLQKSSTKSDNVSNFYSSWTNAGPNDVGGRIRAVRYDQSGNYLLAGGVHGGIWKSTDEGLTWTIKTDAFLNPAINTLSQDPSNSAKWVAFMGESNGSLANRDYNAGMYASGFYSSTDHGETWTFIADEAVSSIFPTEQVSVFSYVSRSVITNDAIYFGSDNYGLYKMSKDFSSIVRVDANNATDLERFKSNRFIDFDYSSSYGMIAAYSNSDQNTSISGSPAGIYYSDDNGATWIDVTPIEYDDYRDEIGRTLVRFSQNDDAFYAMIYWQDTQSVTVLRYEWFNDTEIYEVVIDATTTIEAIDDQYDSETDVMSVGIDTQDEYNMTLSVYPLNSNIVFIGGTSLYRSTNGYETIGSVTRIGGYENENSFESYANHHPDQHELIFNPTNNQIAISAHDSGLSRTTNVLASSVIWENRDDNLVITQFYHVSMPRSTSPSIIGGAQDNGSPAFDFSAAGLTTSSSDFSTGDGAFQYAGESSLFTSSQEGYITYFKFLEGDVTEDYSASPNLSSPLFIHPFAVDLTNDDDLYVPDGADIHYQKGFSTKSQVQIDAGWQTISLSLTSKASKTMTAISVSSTNPSEIIYGGLSAIGSATVKPSVVRIVESTKAHVEYEIVAATAGSYINNIAINPSDGDEIIVSISNYNVIGLFHSVNGGQTFSNVEGSFSSTDLSNRVATITEVEGQTVYFIGTSVGVFYTTEMNGSSTQWTMKNDGDLGYNAVEWMDSRSSDGRVIAATHGRGIFVLSSGVGIDANPFATTITGDAGFRMLSAPIADFTVSDISDDTAIQGVAGGENTGFASNFYYYGSSGTWSFPTNVTTAFGNGYGFIVKFFDNNLNGSKELPITLEVDGTQNSEDVVINLNKTNAETNGEISVYYTLLGNPYTSNVALSELSVNNSGALSANVIIWDNSANDYAIVSRSTGVLAPWQGFWAFVLGSDAATQVTIPVSAKTTNAASSTYFKKNASTVEGLITLTQGDRTSQPFKLFLHDDAKLEFDMYDVSKFTPLSDTYQIIAGRQINSNTLKAIESLPFELTEEVVLSLEPKITSASSDVTVNWTQFNDFPEEYSVELIDTQEGKKFNLREEGSYSFKLEAVQKRGSKSENLTLEGSSIRFLIKINPQVTSTEVSELVPTEVELAQNYPNPFNPTTMISFGLPTTESVKLSVYNSVGQLVRNLVNTTKQAGFYTVQFDASTLSSGIYYYRLEVGDKIMLTKKMVLVK